MDKFSTIFQSAIAVFHGIIATWLFLEFTESTVSEFQFLLLLVCFTVVNVLVWNLIVLASLKIARKSDVSVQLMTSDITRLSYRAVDVVGLCLVAVLASGVAAYAFRNDLLLRVANKFVYVGRTHQENPFNMVMSRVSRGKANELDGRDGKIVARAEGKAYLRIYNKDLKIGYEGFPRASPTRLNPREFFLSPACRYFFDAAIPTTGPIFQLIEGPGAFVRADAMSLEVIDRRESGCATLVDAAK